MRQQAVDVLTCGNDDDHESRFWWSQQRRSTGSHVEILSVFVYLKQLTCFVPSLCPPAHLQVNKGVTVVDLLSFARDLEAQTDLMVS